MIELDDPASAATGAYLAAAMGDMAGRADVFDDIEQGRVLAGIVKDPIILGQLLLLEARVLRRTRDARARSTLEAAIDDLEGKGVLRPAALARRDLGLLELSEGKPGRAVEHLELALSGSAPTRPLGGGAGLRWARGARARLEATAVAVATWRRRRSSCSSRTHPHRPRTSSD